MNTKQQLAAIIASGMTQEMIASRTGVSQPTISRILSEKHADLRVSTADAIDKLHKQVYPNLQIMGQGDAA